MCALIAYRVDSLNWQTHKEFFFLEERNEGKRNKNEIFSLFY